jgi:hypothetical protein
MTDGMLKGMETLERRHRNQGDCLALHGKNEKKEKIR